MGIDADGGSRIVKPLLLRARFESTPPPPSAAPPAGIATFPVFCCGFVKSHRPTSPRTPVRGTGVVRHSLKWRASSACIRPPRSQAVEALPKASAEAPVLPLSPAETIVSRTKCGAATAMIGAVGLAALGGRFGSGRDFVQGRARVSVWLSHLPRGPGAYGMSLAVSG